MTNWVSCWEYRMLVGEDLRLAGLDTLGSQGWELVCINAGGRYIFKRPTGRNFDTLEGTE